jgi:hypothetical protein
LTVTVVYQPLAAAPAQSIFVPSLYRDRIGGLAEALRLDREILGPGDADIAASEISCSQDDARSLTSIVIERAGADLPDELAGLLARARTRLIHVDLAMNDPAIGAAVDVLRGTGFAYGAWLPGWRGHDVLRAQLVREPTDEELAPTLYTSEAVAMCSSIRRELTAGYVIAMRRGRRTRCVAGTVGGGCRTPGPGPGRPNALGRTDFKPFGHA